MTQRSEIDPSMMRYLLGELRPEEQAELDERAFVDDAWEEQRDSAADDLIDAYLTGALGSEERLRFETHFLSSAAHRERFRLLRDLRVVVARKAGPGRGAARVGTAVAWAAAAAALLAALAGLFFYVRSREPDLQVAVATPPPALTPAATPVATPRVTATPEPARTRILTVAVQDASRTVAVTVEPDVRTVRFAIPVPEDGAPSYAVAVREGSETLWRRDDLVPQEAGAPLEVGVPADVLAADAVLSVEPEPVRGRSPAPAAVREWTLRITRR
jgi:hypothetical protein